ncbi:lysophospholipid acyltransferase family protein [Dermatobacter hominis]|uniref:lysophospholipid acyltransferase family protein n=1 Tax=Dermatobacter hominis TaxID=2884263 RepID=UPI001D0F56CA|nr:lysophospholipid acyltransferase family protein [Dermatobacter hominis]UDY36074.1 1-acyl-sn-glycerol-3-phosphate acyltransferase [Dermatobacter hominis]
MAVRLDPTALARRLGFPFTAAPTPPGVEPPVEPDELGDRYDTDWARRPVARATRRASLATVGRIGTAVLARPTVRNLDRLEDLDGNAIFVANHHSHLDTPVLLTHLPRPWRDEMVVAAAADHFFDTKPKAALISWAYGAIPMERKKVSRRSAETSARLIDDGWSLLIFPEGGRSPDGWGQPHKGGAAYLAVRCGVPVVPVHLDGTGRILPKGSSAPRPGAVDVNIGTPLRAREDEDARRFAARLEKAVAELADETETDWWSARLRAHGGGTPGLQGPEDSWIRDWRSPDRVPRVSDSDRRWSSGRRP